MNEWGPGGRRMSWPVSVTAAVFVVLVALSVWFLLAVTP